MAMGMYLLLRLNVLFVLLLLAIVPSSAILYVDMASAEPIAAQLDNSTNIGEEETYSFDSIDGIYGLVLVITIIATAIRAYNPKAKRRVWIAFFLLFSSFVVWLLGVSPTSVLNSLRIFAIFLVILALIVVLYRSKKQVPWKKYEGIRRHFSGQVRQQVLDAQKYKCANCNLSISPPLVHYDHIDGNHSNNDISNCQALCPNCHSLKTDDDRRNQ
jgi:hypothetical protein